MRYSSKTDAAFLRGSKNAGSLKLHHNSVSPANFYEVLWRSPYEVAETMR